MKIFGAVLLVCACTILGMVQAKKLRFRQCCLEGVLDGLRFIDAELKNGAVAIPEIFSELCKLPDSKMNKYYVNLYSQINNLGETSLSDIWCGCALGDKSVSLSERQRQELSRVGSYLGRYSENEQSEAICACIEHLEAQLKSSSEKARQGGRLYMGLGFTFGLMLAAVLI